MMPSPFPGMDPFAETSTRWESLHAWFIRELARNSLPAAIERGCWIDVEKDIYRPDPSGELVLLGEPDNVISVSRASAEKDGGVGTATLPVAAPQAVHDFDIDPYTTPAHRQQYMVVREDPSYPRVLAVVELLSPANKGGSYAPKYQEKRINLIGSDVHFLEIDLLRAGRNPLRERFPELPPTPYFIFLARQKRPGRKEEGYAVRLQDALPLIALPLREGIPDLTLDLGAAFRSAYDLSFGGRPIRYQTEAVPEPALPAEDAEWVKALLAKSPASATK
jgi:hypothetical protein